MNSQFPAIVIICPLTISFLIFISGWWFRRAAFALAIGALAVCTGVSGAILKTVARQGVIAYRLGGWPPPWGLEYRIDHLNAIMLVLVSLLSLLAAVHAQKSVTREMPEKSNLFWGLFILMITGLLGICITGDLFNLFVMLEVAALSGYALIAMGTSGALYASFRYLLMGTLGACFYLLGVGYLYLATGSLNMADLAGILPQIYHSKVVLAGFTFIMIGLGIKMALFPLHAWLPDAYTRAPAAVSATVAPLVTKVMAYVAVRVMFTVFKPEFSIGLLGINDLLVWVGSAAILFGAVMALSQNDFKRMLSYIIIAEMGYIVGGIGVANAIALQGVIFHILNDALMMACLFLVAAQIRHQTGGTGISHFQGFFKSMPMTAFTFTVGALAVIGVPPACGFFSKWYLLLGGIQAKQWGVVAALMICTLINVALFFRIFDKGLYTHAADNHTVPSETDKRPDTGGEAPLSMLVPTSILAVLILLVGVFNQIIINTVIRFAVPPGL